ncbi:uncharacterized protein LOC114714512 [Neltuma alba]|uniref:uncharacterized protein LOC114714512 n=1 Tax=Neltuma alba TaxID=207710 RepID=UPI0010A3B117|nr:uncharacterized protein LOC114714512 [Prosopis alba]
MESTERGRLQHMIFGAVASREEKWRPPLEGVMRLDVDGSVNQHRQAACGGLVRDAAGRWRIGFQRRLGVLPPTAAELMALLTGLQMCKQQGFSKIEVFTDSIEVLRLIETEGGASHFLQTELTEIRELIYSDWDVSINHAPRKVIQ